MVRTKEMAKRRVKGEIAKPEPDKDGGRKARRLRPGTRALREIRKAQGSNGVKGVPRASFAKLVRKLLPEDVRISKQAMQTLQASAEDYAVDLFTLSNTLTVHAGRLGVDVDDMRLARNVLHNPHFVKESDGTKKMLKGSMSSEASAFKRSAGPADKGAKAGEAAKGAKSAKSAKGAKPAKSAKGAKPSPGEGKGVPEQAEEAEEYEDAEDYEEDEPEEGEDDEDPEDVNALD